MRRNRRTPSQATQLKNAKAEVEKLKKEIEVLKGDQKIHQDFFIKEYKLHLSCLEKKDHLNTESAIKRYSVALNKVQPFYTGLV